MDNSDLLLEDQLFEHDGKRDFVSKAEIFEQLKRLAQLHAQREFSDAEYEQRKAELIDLLTGTSREAKSRDKKTVEKIQQSAETFIASSPATVHTALAIKGIAAHRPRVPIRRVPTDWRTSPVDGEDALRHEFLLDENRWARKRIRIRLVRDLLATTARGRKSYFVVDCNPNRIFVAPLSNADDEMARSPMVPLRSTDEKRSLGRQIETRTYARAWALSYNACNPPKRIEFSQAWLLELCDRFDRPVCVLEEFLMGPIRRYVSADGLVMDGSRNSPHAFAHFTYEASGKRIIICKLQGIQDLYVDPLIIDCHGTSEERQTVRNFIQNHQCNSICKYLKLAPFKNGKPFKQMDDDNRMTMARGVLGETVPQTTVMQMKRPPLNPVAAGLPAHIADQHKCCCTLM